ncbi:MAG: single-stranded DNA-binding protein [Aquificaceae bacterium]|nr:single-stranded DNA-binding protein [Aquificaceae bacterium]
MIGRLTDDPKTRHVSDKPDRGTIVEFSIAYNRRYPVGEEGKEESHFFDVKAFGRLAQSLGERLLKGYLVVLEGRLVQEKWTDREGKHQTKVRIVAESVKIISKPKGESVQEEDTTDGPFGDEGLNF